jgi:hypothetical protein
MSLPVAETATPLPTQMPEWMTEARPRAAFVAALAAATVAAAALSWDRPGIGWPVTALVVLAAVLVSVRSRRHSPWTGRAWPARATIRACWAVAAGMLLTVGAVRAAGWLFVLCVLTAGFIGCVALTDRRSIGGVLLAPLRVAGSAPAALRWLVRGRIRMLGQDSDMLVRTPIAALISVALLLGFGFLLASADAAFAQVLSTMVTSLDRGTVLRWTGSAAGTITVTAVAAHILLTGETAPEHQSHLGLVRRVEWALPVSGLVTLFAGFVAVQATVLFGGSDHVLTTAGLTYAQYARSGFWQLLAVTGLTVIVIGVVAQIAPRSTTADRILLRTLLGPLSALAVVIVASALTRMAAYEQAYGFTRQRLLVTAFELWLGIVFLLILIAGIRLQGRWVPQAALAPAVATLLGMAVLNPDDFIARQNIARYAETGRIDVDYLKTLSPDAVPALHTLPEPHRSCALAAIKTQLATSRPETWLEWNLGRGTARAQLHDHPPASASPLTCPP